jgi:hypothetical protein
MFKFIAQLLISATVGVAVAAGSDATVRGYVGEALREPGAYIQESASAVANTVAHFSSDANTNTAVVNADANTTVNESTAVEAADTSESAPAVSVQSSSDVQVDSNLNVQEALPELLGLQADTSADTQTQTDASVDTEDSELSLLEQLGLTLGFDVSEDK